jgi:hypothetical protein
MIVRRIMRPEFITVKLIVPAVVLPYQSVTTALPLSWEQPLSDSAGRPRP